MSHTVALELPLRNLLDSLAAWRDAAPANRQLLGHIAAVLTLLTESSSPAEAESTPPLPGMTDVVAPVEPPPLPTAPPAETSAAARVVAPAGTLVPAPATVRGPTLTPEYAAQALRGGLFGRGTTTLTPTLPAFADTPIDFSVIERRCRVKADACDFALRRQRHVAAGGSIYDLKDEYEAIMARAKALDPCYLWVNKMRADEGYPDDVLENAKRWYGALAGAIALLREDPASPDRDIVECVAQAQSGLMATLAEVEFEDRDVQIPIFRWLRTYTETQRVYLPRFLSRDTAADPASWSAALESQEAARQKVERHRADEKARKTAISDVRYHVKRLPGLTDEDAARAWAKIDDALSRFVRHGGNLDATHVRQTLAPAPRPSPASLDALSANLAALLAPPDVDDTDDGDTLERRDTPEIAKAREALRGTNLVLIGGIEKPNPKARLIEAFELAGLDWITTGEHESLTRFEPAIARAETALVVVMIRWASHSYEGVKALAEKHGKMYLRLTGGYNPSQIAHQFLKQNSRRAGLE